MAIFQETAKLLLDEAAREPFTGSALVLSRMKVFFRWEELLAMARERGVALRDVQAPRLSFDPQLARLGCLDDRTFFAALGLDEVLTVDVSDYEGVDRLVDLNEPLPEELRGRFDLVFDGGTVQHVFHLPNLLRNVHLALREGGRAVFSIAASHNHVDHGFYMFSPTFFHDYWSANDYKIEAFEICEFESAWLAGRLYAPYWRNIRYEPGCLDHLSYGGFGRRQLAIFAIATRAPGATATTIPQQGHYRRIWGEAEAGPAPGAASAGLGGRLESWVAARGHRHPWLLAAVLAAKRRWVALRRVSSRRRLRRSRGR